MPDALSFSLNERIAPGELGDLRESVGWDRHADHLGTVLASALCIATCRDGDRLVGYVDVLSDRACDAFVRDLIVHPDHQSRGIGRRLVSMVAEYVRGAGPDSLYVLFDQELAPFYERCGFRIIGGGAMDLPPEDPA